MCKVKRILNLGYAFIVLLVSKNKCMYRLNYYLGLYELG